jgi:predicted dinucleotide-binding enzyme
MKFAIIGAGNVGSAIARAVTDAGHHAVVSAASEEDFQGFPPDVPATKTTSNREAVADADTVVLAVPFPAVDEVVSDLRSDLAGKIVIDVTNPLAPDLSGLATDNVSSAELVARAAPQARVVKAFNTVFAANQANPSVEGTQLDGFVAGDDADAKRVVMECSRRSGTGRWTSGHSPRPATSRAWGSSTSRSNARNGWSWQSGWKLVGPLS